MSTYSKSRYDKIEDMKTWDVWQLIGLASLSTDGYRDASLSFHVKRDSLLASLTQNVAQLTLIMREARCIIAGEAALSLLLTKYTPRATHESPITFICPCDTFESFSIHLVHHLQGTIVDEIRAERGNVQEGVSQHRLIRMEHSTVNVECAAGFCASLPISHAPTTHEFTFLTWDTLCVAYPATTLLGRTVERPTWTEEDRHRASWEYMEFNFARSYSKWPGERGLMECWPEGYCTRVRRFFGDEHCLTFKFDHSSGLSNDHIMMATQRDVESWTTAWVFGGPGCGTVHCMLNMDPVHDLICEKPLLTVI